VWGGVRFVQLRWPVAHWRVMLPTMKGDWDTAATAESSKVLSLSLLLSSHDVPNNFGPLLFVSLSLSPLSLSPLSLLLFSLSSSLLST